MRGKLNVRGPDFMGHDITWTDDDGEGFTLKIGLANRSASEPHRQRWSYTLWDRNYDAEMSVFNGDDFETSMMVVEDDADIVSSLLGFLSLNDGDTDSEYFADYTERQITWRDERAEALSMYAIEEDEQAMPVQVNTTGENVVVLTIEHRHGIDISAYRTYDGASKAVAQYVEDWWGDLSRWSEDPPKMPEDENEAVRLYFEIMEDETATYNTVPLGE